MTSSRVLFCFSSDAIGGAERNLMRVAGQVAEYGFDAHVAAIGSGTGPVAELAKKSGLHFVQLPERGTGLSKATAAYRSIRKFDPDIIYAVGLRAATLMRGMLAGWSKAAYVGAQRSVPSARKCRAQRLLAGRRGLIIANSDAGKEALLHVGMPAQRVHVILNGLPSITPWREPPPVFQKSFVCVANLLPVKGHEYLLAAFERYLGSHPDAKLCLIGRDERAGEVHAIVERSPALRESVAIKGYVEDVSAELRAADAFVLSSLLEGMPTAALEAMAESLPVIATRVGGTPELVKDRRTGLLVPPADVDSLFEAMTYLTEDFALRERLRAAGHAHVLAHHSFDRVMEQHADVFSGLLRG